MSDVTRLDRRAHSTSYSINPDLIERIDENPDASRHGADCSTPYRCRIQGSNFVISQPPVLVSELDSHFLAVGRLHRAGSRTSLVLDLSLWLGDGNLAGGDGNTVLNGVHLEAFTVVVGDLLHQLDHVPGGVEVGRELYPDAFGAGGHACSVLRSAE